MLFKESVDSKLEGASPRGSWLEGVSSEAVGVEGVPAEGTGTGGKLTEKSRSNNNSPVLVKT